MPATGIKAVDDWGNGFATIPPWLTRTEKKDRIMKIYDVEQNTTEWYAVRRGIPTASGFDKIITAGGKPSSQSSDYIDTLVSEYITAEDCKTFQGNAHTERGKLLEPQAIKSYEMINCVDVKKVGFVTDDARTMGCSPDALVGDDGGLEMKCPQGNNHVYYMRTNKHVDEYRVQVQGNLLVTGRRWWDVMSYHPKMKPVIVRVERNNDFLMRMSRMLMEFNQELADRIAQLRKDGFIDEDETGEDVSRFLRAG